MISRSEIKKCGFKASTEQGIGKVFERNIPEGKALLDYLDEKTGHIQIMTKSQMATGDTQDVVMALVFDGCIPARYELQIILRCLQIA